MSITFYSFSIHNFKWRLCFIQYFRCIHFENWGWTGTEYNLHTTQHIVWHSFPNTILSQFLRTFKVLVYSQCNVRPELTKTIWSLRIGVKAELHCRISPAQNIEKNYEVVTVGAGTNIADLEKVEIYYYQAQVQSQIQVPNPSPKCRSQIQVPNLKS